MELAKRVAGATEPRRTQLKKVEEDMARDIFKNHGFKEMVRYVNMHIDSFTLLRHICVDLAFDMAVLMEELEQAVVDGDLRLKKNRHLSKYEQKFEELMDGDE